MLHWQHHPKRTLTPSLSLRRVSVAKECGSQAACKLAKVWGICPLAFRGFATLNSKPLDPKPEKSRYGEVLVGNFGGSSRL